MTFRASMLIEANAGQAKAELRDLAAETAKAGGAAEEMGRRGGAAAGQTRALGTAADGAAADVRALGAAEQAAATEAVGLANANRAAAGQMGNLTAQFNDIGVMMAAGQNPLTLALQQGTQISQVLGPMGARGAVQALGGAFLGMLNPISLVTIGSIAAGAAMVNWFTDAEPAAASLDEAVESMSERVDAYVAASRRARRSTAEWRAEAGRFATEAQQQAIREAEARLRDAQRGVAEAFAKISEGIDTRRPDFGDQSAMADTFDLSLLGRGRQERQALVNEVLASYAQLDRATTGGSVEEQYDALERTVAAYSEAAAAAGGITVAEDQNLRLLREQLTVLRENMLEREAAARASEPRDWPLMAEVGQNANRVALMRQVLLAEEEAAQAASERQAEGRALLADMQQEARLSEIIARHGEDSVQAASLRAALERETTQAMLEGKGFSGEMLRDMMAAYDARVAGEQEAQDSARLQSARDMIRALEEEADIQRLIAVHGDESVEVAQARISAERAAAAAAYDSEGNVASLKGEYMAAWDAANGVASVDMDGNVSLAVGQATALADELGRALANAMALSAQGLSTLRQSEIALEFRGDPVGREAALARERFDAATEVPPGTDSTILNMIEQERREVVAQAAETERNRQELQAWQREQAEAAREAKGGGSRGKRGSRSREETEARRQREAVTDLITGLEDELAIMREADPVRQEMLRHREALTAATEAERMKVEDLIAAREAERLALEDQRETMDFARSTLFDTMDGLTQRGATAADVLGGVADAIRRAALEALILGEGPFSQYFGLGGEGGLADMMLGAVFPGLGASGGGAPRTTPTGTGAALELYAEGGMLHGPGSGTSDDILMMGSAGEFMVNARATSRHRHLLEYLNAGGDLPGFAGGGAIGGGTAGAGFGAPSFVIENHGTVPVQEVREDGTDTQGRRKFRLVMADEVGAALTARGGGARRVLHQTYGARPKRPLR
ncbi:phage tail length tape measure family protein [Limimaricola variabilis]|uniref:phage tail length tape measure family protein n=1 Tax=Limimaricola variabilis TaxID=1492771 RepID=UPI002AC972A3|nr:phage tail length tape measure family protein [Limimaricola variabilis]WPY94674.1 phage tail length tape measure family protein [Limimaricola variabilis]